MVLKERYKKYYKNFMKKYCELERCYKCKESKVILKEILFYGKVKYICRECNNLVEAENEKGYTATWGEIYYPKNWH